MDVSQKLPTQCLKKASYFSDSYSEPQYSVAHMLVERPELKEIRTQRDEGVSNDMMQFRLIMEESNIPTALYDVSFESGASAKIAWPKTYGGGDTIPIKFIFLGPDGKLLQDVRYGFVVKDQAGNEIIKKIGKQPLGPGFVALEGIDVINTTFEKDGQYILDVAIFGQGPTYKKDYQGLTSTNIAIEKEAAMTGEDLTSQKQDSKQTKEIVLPSWVKRSAQWWAEGQVGDKDFAKGIEFMIKENIIDIPVSEDTKQQSSQAEDKIDIPDWVKRNAKWWAEGQVGDKDFATGIEHLVKIGVITV